MKSWAFGGSVLAIVAVAAWSYHVNYETKTAQARVADLKEEIASTREAIEVLEVEWEWLNNPIRLAALVDGHPELGLAPRRPESWARASDLPYPEPEMPEIAESAGDDSTGNEETLAGLTAAPGVPVPPPRPRWRP